MQQYQLAIHGGAGTITREMMTSEKEANYHQALNDALLAGQSILEQGGSALDAVESSVIVLENNSLFNAGKGSVFTHFGTHEMDAAIMEGSGLRAGAVTGVSSLKNPIAVARLVMDKSEHVMLSGEGAEIFAKLQGCNFENSDYFFDAFRHAQWQEIVHTEKVQLDHTERKFGTVGAVALDAQGNLAAATSTGGMTNKRWGRIGDTPVIGSGTYANNKTCAISCTGHGEFFMRAVVAYDISCLMEYKGMGLQEACDLVVMQKLVDFGGEGGLVAVDRLGNISLSFNSEGMYRGWCNSRNLETAIYK